MDIVNQMHHIRPVVHYIQKTVAYYESVGIAPWHDDPPLAEFKRNL